MNLDAVEAQLLLLMQLIDPVEAEQELAELAASRNAELVGPAR